MNRTLQQEPKTVQDVAAVAPAFHLPDATSAMQGAVTGALDYCADRLGLPSPQVALERIRQGNSRAVDYCHYSLAQQAAEALGALDDNIQAVFLYDLEATPEDRALGDSPEYLPIHLLVRAGRKTSALSSLITALDRALVKDYAQMIGPRRLRHVLDVQVIDSSDLESRRGIATLLYSLHNRPIQLWAR